MRESIQAGTVLIKEFTPFPGAFTLTSEAYVPGWQVVKNLDAYALDRKFREAGWNFFYLANEINVIALGLAGQKRIRRAIERIVARLDTRKFNALEITRVNSKRFLGLPCITISAHPRHIQESIRLFQAKDFRDSGSSKADHLLDPVPAFATTIHARPEEPAIPLSWDNNSASFGGAFR